MIHRDAAQDDSVRPNLAETTLPTPPAASAPRPVAVGVTVFRPTEAQVAALLARVEADPRLTIVFDNGGLPADAAIWA